MINKFKKFISLIAKGNLKELYLVLSNLIYRKWRSLGLKRDLNEQFKNPEAKIKISVRELVEADKNNLFDLAQSNLSAADKSELSLRKEFLDQNFGKCFVAVDENNQACYVQWLFTAADNSKVQSYFNARFPILEKDEALLENAYTPVQFRGQGIMPAAMAQISEKARDFGARYVLTFVADDNIPSLKGCQKAGFYPYLVRLDSWFLHPKFLKRKFEEHTEK